MIQKDPDVQCQCSVHKPTESELCQHLLVAFVFSLVTCHLGSTVLDESYESEE